MATSRVVVSESSDLSLRWPLTGMALHRGGLSFRLVSRLTGMVSQYASF